VAVGLPATVLLANAIGWHATFALLALVPLLLLPAVVRVIPDGQREPSARVDLGDAIGRYARMLRDRSLAVMYVFWVLYVACAFGSGAYAAALTVSRGFGAGAVGVLFAVVGGVFIVSSVVSPEVLGRWRVDLRWLVAAVAVVFFATRAAAFFLPLPFVGLLVLFGLGSVMDGCMGVAMRSLIASYEVPEQALSMVFLESCGSLGQTLGGVVAGMALAIGGYPAIGLLMGMLCLFAAWLPILSGRLMQAATPRISKAPIVG
jgi:predicted MFS family arabinose efflux permease